MVRPNVFTFHNTITFYQWLIHGLCQTFPVLVLIDELGVSEHRNMPLDDALELVARNFEEYNAERVRREKLEYSFKAPDAEESHLLAMLADNKYLKIEELNRVIRYLSDRRDALIVKAGGVLPTKNSGELNYRSNTINLTSEGVRVRLMCDEHLVFRSDANGTTKEDAGLAKQQQELQEKILSALGEHTVVTKPDTSFDDNDASPSSSPTDVKMTSPVSAKIDLSSPGLQQALNTLISNSGDLLKNLKSSGKSSAEERAGAATDDSPPYAGSRERSEEFEQQYEPNYNY